MAIQVAADSCYAEISHAALNVGKFTVLGWFKVDDLAAKRSLWALGDASADVVNVYTAHYASDKLTGACFTPTGGGANDADYEGSYVPPVTTWFHAAHIWDITGTILTSNPRQFVNCAPDPTVLGGGGAVTQALPATTKFRVFANFTGDYGRGGAAMVRVFRGPLTARDIRLNMYSRRCPTHLRARCLVDAPLEGDLINRGRLGGALATTGTVTFTASPNVMRRPTRRPLDMAFFGAFTQTISPSGIATSTVIGTAEVTPAPWPVDATGIDTSTAIGDPTVIGPRGVSPTSISTATAFGSPFVYRAPTGDISGSLEASRTFPASLSAVPAFTKTLEVLS